MRTQGRVDSGTCGVEDVWTQGRVDSGTCGLEDVDLRRVWTLRLVGSRTCGIGDLWARRHVDSVVHRNSLSAVPNRSQRSCFGLIYLLAYHTVTALSTE